MAKIFDADKFYNRLKEELKNEVSTIRKNICLASVVTVKDASCKIYTSIQQALAKQLNIKYLLINLGSTASLNTVTDKIEELNKDESITGIILNRPFPKDIKDSLISSVIAPNKDIEGISIYNLGRICIGEPLFIPPTVLSILTILESTKNKIYGKDVTLVGFSNIIGKPLSMILADKLATVNITHIGTYEADRLAFYVSQADILVTAVGKPHIIKGEWIKKNAVVIDVGIAKKNGKIFGDVEFEVAKKRASFITTVPGGVGKLTPLFLFKNLLKAAKLDN